jgi:ADP-ribose pyrophosphatase YjhB (NUDIX family)
MFHSIKINDSKHWTPHVTVAAIISRKNRFLMVEEKESTKEQHSRLVLNHPAGHLEPYESLIQACKREVLEETNYDFEPKALIGIYLAKSRRTTTGKNQSYLRFAFTGTLGQHHPEYGLDDGIVKNLWLNIEEIRTQHSRLRSPVILKCLEDYIKGQRFSLDALFTHPHVFD